MKMRTGKTGCQKGKEEEEKKRTGWRRIRPRRIIKRENLKEEW